MAGVRTGDLLEKGEGMTLHYSLIRAAAASAVVAVMISLGLHINHWQFWALTALVTIIDSTAQRKGRLEGISGALNLTPDQYRIFKAQWSRAEQQDSELP